MSVLAVISVHGDKSARCPLHPPKADIRRPAEEDDPKWPTRLSDKHEQTLAQLRGPKTFEIVPGASHLFSEPGALETMIEHSVRWFTRYLAKPAAS